MESFTLLEDGRSTVLPATLRDGRVGIAPDSLHEALGWELKPEGLCRGALCVPVADRAALVAEDGIDLEAFAAALGRPLALDVEERAAALGVAAADRAERLASLEAPDFTLPDLDGRLHSLSEHRGKKVLLVAYASW
jgi:hypothetical protein